MEDNLKSVGKVGNGVQDLRATHMVTRISSNEEHVDRPFAVVGEAVHYRIMARHEIGRFVATLAHIGQEAREIANNQIVHRKIDIARWHGTPGDGSLDAAGQPLNKPVAEMNRIESVKDLGTMCLDLREQDVLERRL